MSQRLLIIGCPRTEKTTLADRLGKQLSIPVQHFDDTISQYGWSEHSEAIADWLDEPGPWIKEGVAGIRGLRKWLAKHPGEVPTFSIRVENEPKVTQNAGQLKMQKASDTMLNEVLVEISRRRGR